VSVPGGFMDITAYYVFELSETRTSGAVAVNAAMCYISL
jgi:hypothetical protein